MKTVVFVVIGLCLCFFSVAGCKGENQLQTAQTRIQDSDGDKVPDDQDCAPMNPNLWKSLTFWIDADHDNISDAVRGTNFCVGEPKSYPDGLTLNNPPPLEPCSCDTNINCGAHPKIQGMETTPQGPIPPTILITSPAAKNSFTMKDQITIKAEAEAIDGRVVKVEFYLDGNLIAADVTEPYTFQIQALRPGKHMLYAVARINCGSQSTSSTVIIDVDPLKNLFIGNLDKTLLHTDYFEWSIYGMGFQEPANFSLSQ